MPVAVTSLEDTTRKELKTAPPDGYVVLRRMTYGQIIHRRTMNKLSFMTGGSKRSLAGEMAMASKEVSLFEFASCVVEHNLFDKDGETLLNLGNSVDFDKLDPRIGQEIESYIGEMNNFDDEEEGKSLTASEQASS
jgi:hypothetical protein